MIIGHFRIVWYFKINSILNFKGVLNTNFRSFSLNLKKIRFFKIYFDQGLQSSVTSENEEFEILFLFSSYRYA